MMSENLGATAAASTATATPTPHARAHTRRDVDDDDDDDDDDYGSARGARTAPRHGRAGGGATMPRRRCGAATSRGGANTPAGAGDVEPASPLGVFRLEYDISKVRAGAARAGAGSDARGNGWE